MNGGACFSRLGPKRLKKRLENEDREGRRAGEDCRDHDSPGAVRRFLETNGMRRSCGSTGDEPAAQSVHAAALSVDHGMCDLLNDTIARRCWRGMDPLQFQIRREPFEPFTIVGIVSDTRTVRPCFPTRPAVYVPLDQSPSFRYSSPAGRLHRTRSRRCFAKRPEMSITPCPASFRSQRRLPAVKLSATSM